MGFVPTAHLRKMRASAIQGPMKTCRNGHPQTPENIAVSRQGYTSCRVCTRLAQRERYDRELRATYPHVHRVYSRP